MGQVGRIAVGLLALWGVSPPSAWGQDAARTDVTAALRVSAAAQKLVLGEDSETQLNVNTPPEVTAAQLSVRASAGEVVDLRREGPGRFSARYRTPGAYHPQVALISAVATQGDRLLVGQTALPLWGRGEAEVRTQPRVEVRVRIGKQTFGPVRADQRGRATVKVVVPPGTHYGWDRRRKVDLKVPPTRRLYVRATPERFIGVSTQRVVVLLFTVDDQGRLSSAVAPQLTGELTAEVRALGTGAFVATLEVPAGAPGVVVVPCALPGVAAGDAPLQLRRIAGPPARLALTAGAARGAAPVDLQLRVEDARGTAVDGAALEVKASAGETTAVQRTGPGEYRAEFRPPAEGRGRVTYRIRAAAEGGLASESEVTVAYPPPPLRRGLRAHWFWTAAGVGGALLVSGIVTRAVALDKSAEYKDPETTIPRRRELKDVGEPLTTYSTVALAVGGAVAAGAVALFFLTDFGGDGERTATQGAAVVPMPGGAQAVFQRSF